MAISVTINPSGTRTVSVKGTGKTTATVSSVPKTSVAIENVVGLDIGTPVDGESLIYNADTGNFESSSPVVTNVTGGTF